MLLLSKDEIRKVFSMQDAIEADKDPVTEDTLEKDVFVAEKPTVSIDGQKVEKGTELLYTITYTNRDDFAAEVQITDVIPAHTAYVADSADNGAKLQDGALRWTLQLEAGESKTVSFRVTVLDAEVAVENTATALEGENKLESNRVVSEIPAPPTVTPETGDNSALQLWFGLMAASAVGLFVLILSKKRIVA